VLHRLWYLKKQDCSLRSETAGFAPRIQVVHIGSKTNLPTPPSPTSSCVGRRERTNLSSLFLNESKSRKMSIHSKKGKRNLRKMLSWWRKNLQTLSLENLRARKRLFSPKVKFLAAHMFFFLVRLSLWWLDEWRKVKYSSPYMNICTNEKERNFTFIKFWGLNQKSSFYDIWCKIWTEKIKGPNPWRKAKKRSMHRVKLNFSTKTIF